MDSTGQTILAVVIAVVGSSGFWAYILQRYEKDSAEKQMLRGLGHDRIMELGLSYLKRGDWITKSEYENLHDYLFTPYSALHGNGSAERVMKDVDRCLRIVDDTYTEGGNSNEKQNESRLA